MDFLSPLKKLLTLAGFESTNFGSNGKHDNHWTTEGDEASFKVLQRRLPRTGEKHEKSQSG
jgi:hypothetical protein